MSVPLSRSRAPQGRGQKERKLSERSEFLRDGPGTRSTGSPDRAKGQGAVSFGSFLWASKENERRWIGRSHPGSPDARSLHATISKAFNALRYFSLPPKKSNQKKAPVQRGPLSGAALRFSPRAGAVELAALKQPQLLFRPRLRCSARCKGKREGTVGSLLAEAGRGFQDRGKMRTGAGIWQIGS